MFRTKEWLIFLNVREVFCTEFKENCDTSVWILQGGGANQQQATASTAAAGSQQPSSAGASSQPQQAQPQVIQLQPQQMVNTMAPPPGGIQIVQQVVGPDGQIQQIPIQLTSQQLQMIR